MSYNVSTQNVSLGSGQSETVVVVQDTNSNTNNEQSVSVAVDYSDYYSRIATATETLLSVIENMQQDIDLIKQHLDVIQDRGSDRNKGLYFGNTENGNLTPRQQRAVVLNAIKSSGGLDGLKDEIENPTSLPTGDNE